MLQTPTRVREAIIFAVIFLSCIYSHAQSNINGSVADSYKQPLGDATVLLLNTRDSSLVKGTTTARNGQYSFTNISPGSYLLVSTFINYKQVYTKPFSVSGGREEINLTEIQLAEKETQLTVVKVTARKPLFEQKIDRMVVNVAGSITAAGSTALEVLEKSPGIIVDHQNNSLSMNGKDGVVIMINGRISRMPVAAVMQMLAGMSSSNIEKIELITTQPANYDAEGNAGFINIVLKTNSQYGTNGSYSITAGYGKGLITSASMNFNHRRGKIKPYCGYFFFPRDKKKKFFFFPKVMNQGKSIETYSGTDRNPTVTNFDGRLGLDYELNKKTVVGALFPGYANRFAMTAQN